MWPNSFFPLLDPEPISRVTCLSFNALRRLHVLFLPSLNFVHASHLLFDGRPRAATYSILSPTRWRSLHHLK